MTNQDTQFFDPRTSQQELVRQALKDVFQSLKEKGYDPINQFVGYIVSDDPTYITNYNNARSKIAHFSRDEILEELFRTFIDANDLNQK